MDTTRIVKTPFEAVSIRYVHDGRNGEFLNIGVVLFAPTAPFAGVRFLQSWSRITAAFPGAEIVLLRRIAKAFEKWMAEWSATIGQLPLEPLRGVAALVAEVLHADDSSIQVSPTISGVTSDPQRTLAELFEVYAARQQTDEARRPSRDDGDVWKQFAQLLNEPALVRRLQQRHVLRARHYEFTFDNAWKNGRWNVAQPLSLDLVDPRSIREKATSWSGRVLTLRPSEADTNVYFLVGMPGKDATKEVREAAADALAILGENLKREAEVLTEDQGQSLAAKIVTDLSAHSAEPIKS
jgi:hypothetical protein